MILEKLFQEATKLYNKNGGGYYSIIDNPIEFIDVSNDGIKDLIIDHSTQRCSDSSLFIGGVGGNDYTFFINPSVDLVKSWNPSKLDLGKNGRKGI